MDASGGSTGVSLVLTCKECGARQTLRPHFRLTKWGVLRLHAPSHTFFVNGFGAWCARCVPAHMKDDPAQRETWDEYDRRHLAEMEVEA